MSILVNSISLSSLYAEVYIEMDLEPIGTATVFCIQFKSKKYLITNWHVVTGLHPDTSMQLGKYSNPNFLKVYFHSATMNAWIPKWIPLLVEGQKNWIEYSINGQFYDVIAIPVDDEALTGVSFMPLDITLPDIGQRLKIYPSKDVSIIGFPEGYVGSENLPIWKTGNIATEYDVNYLGKPIFLIDATVSSPFFRTI